MKRKKKKKNFHSPFRPPNDEDRCCPLSTFFGHFLFALAVVDMKVVKSAQNDQCALTLLDLKLEISYIPGTECLTEVISPGRLPMLSTGPRSTNKRTVLMTNDCENCPHFLQ